MQFGTQSIVLFAWAGHSSTTKLKFKCIGLILMLLNALGLMRDGSSRMAEPAGRTSERVQYLQPDVGDRYCRFRRAERRFRIAQSLTGLNESRATAAELYHSSPAK